MLEPNSRQLLMDSLQPPDGYRLDWAVGTTYSLDLVALLTAPVAFAFSDWQNRDGSPIADPLALLKAVRQYAQNICLFCQAGRVLVPKAYQSLFAHLEDSVVQATALNGGSFHPKLWILRFKNQEGLVLYRVLCLSRNMTFDRCWDTLLSLEGELKDRANAFSNNHPLGQMVESLPKMSTRPLSPLWQKRLSELAYEIRRVEFEVPEPFEGIRFWPIGISKSRTWPFPERMDRMLVVSPFVGDGLIGELAAECSTIKLLSRSESLAKLMPNTFEHLKKVWILDDSANLEPGDSEESQMADQDAQPSGQDLANDEPENPLIGLHAKVYIVDYRWNTSVFTGSANATRSAFDKNVEFLVELQGKRSICGVDQVLPDAPTVDHKRGSLLADLVVEYDPKDTKPITENKEEQFEWLVEQIGQQLAQQRPVAKCEVLPEAKTIGVRVIPEIPATDVTTHGCRLSIRPVSWPATQFQRMDPSKLEWAVFPSISLLGLTSFFVLEVHSVDEQFRRQFVLNIPLVDAPENRHELILKELLHDRDRVLKFLLLMLTDSSAKGFSFLTDSTTDGEISNPFIPSELGSTLFESLVKALDRDPERIDHVADIVDDLRRSEDGNSLLPEDFESIWNPIHAVRERQKLRQQKRANRDE